MEPTMVCNGGGVDEDGIHVADGFIAIDKGAEDVIHHHQEGGWQVAQSKEHDKWLKESLVCGESCLPLIPFLQLDIVEAPTEVQGGEPFCIAQPGEHVRDQWKWVGVLHHDLVQLLVVLHSEEAAFLLLDKQHRSSDWRLQQIASSICQFISAELIKLLLLA